MSERTRELWEPVAARTVHSPLRYPGGKRRLVPYVRMALAVNGRQPELLAEPFVGGASVALELVASGAVERIGLADRDPLVASFWQVACFDCDWLVEQVESVELDLLTWRKFKASRPRSIRQRALTCLYLNRTSFNGALHRRAGAIGGQAQAGKYVVGCRFPRERLVARLRAVEALAAAGKVAFVRCASARDTLGWVRREYHGTDLFWYLDPPFWAKSDRLYRFGFSTAEHKRFASAVRYLREPWLLSYDPAPEVLELYAHHRARRAVIELLYTGSQRSAGEEIVISNLPELPLDTRLWRTNTEWEDFRLSARADSPEEAQGGATG